MTSVRKNTTPITSALWNQYPGW